MEKSSRTALLAIIGVNFLWGLDFIVIEYMMEYVSPTIFTLTRLIIGTVILMAIVMVKYKGLHIKKEDWPRMFISGAVGMAIYFTVENLGTGMTSASFSSLIMATVPVFGMIERDGKLNAFVVNDVGSKTLTKWVARFVTPSSVIVAKFLAAFTELCHISSFSTY